MSRRESVKFLSVEESTGGGREKTNGAEDLQPEGFELNS